MWSPSLDYYYGKEPTGTFCSKSVCKTEISCRISVVYRSDFWFESWFMLLYCYLGGFLVGYQADSSVGYLRRSAMQ